MMKGKLLKLIFLLTWIKKVLQITRIINLKTPNVDFSNGQIGYVTLTTIWRVKINHDVPKMDRMYLRAVFPFPITTPVEVKWAKVGSTCDKIRQKNQVTGTVITGDVTGSQVFVIENAEFVKDGTYYMEFLIKSPPGTVGTDTFYDPVYLSIISTDTTTNFITYAYNPAFANFFSSPDASANVIIDTSPTTPADVPKSDLITKTFSSLIDLTINTDGAERILLKLSDYEFAHDSAQTCEFLSTPGYKYFTSSEYECFLEGQDYKGVYITLKSGSFTNGDKVRLQIKVKNPDIPGSTSLTAILLPRYSGDIIEYNTLSSAFSCSAIDYATDFPKLYVGPDLLVSSSNYPGLPLYSTGNSNSAIIFNSIKIVIKPKYDLPEPSDYYQLEVKIGGGANTLVPHNLIYESFNKATGKDGIEITVDPTDKIIVKNIGSLSSLGTYGIGFKLGLSGTESFTWGGATDFLSIILKDSSGLVVINSASPVNIPASVQVIQSQTQPSSGSMPTLFHSLLPTAIDSEYSAISSSNYGLRKGTGMNWFLRSNLVKGSAVNTQNAIEIITNMKIAARNTLAFTDANIGNNCFNKANSGVDVTDSITNCRYDYMNKGQSGEEYSRFRIMGKTNNFWAPNTGTNYMWGFKNIEMNVQNSLYLNDQDAAILDTYINIYNDVGGTDPEATFPATPDSTYMDNMIVLNPTALDEITIDFPNYYRKTNDELDGEFVPTFLRISGILNGINTVQAQKILLFYNDFEPLYLDATEEYEIGCSNSDEFRIRCYKQPGLANGQGNCNGGTTCTNKLFRDRIEIHFTTATISTANAENIQVLIPIKLPQGSHANFNFALGVASTHSGGYGDFNQLIEYRELPTIVRPPSASTSSVSGLIKSSGDTNDASSIKPKVVFIDTSVKGMIGEKYQSKLDMDCDFNSNPECQITTAGEYYSVTFCAQYDFMAGGDFDIPNTQQDFSTFEVYKKCVQDLRYYHATAGNKYCVWCAIWASGLPEDSRAVNNFLVPDYYDNKWPVGTYGALSGRNTQYGLVAITNLNLITTQAFIPNRIRNVRVEPTTWYKSYKSMKLKIEFQTTNRILAGGSVIVTSNAGAFPVTFAKTPNDYCFLTYNGATQICQAVISGVDMIITIATEVQGGDISIELFGLIINPTVSDDQISYRIQTSSDQGTTSDFFMDESEAEAFVIQYEDHPSGLVNKFSIESVEYGVLDQGALSSISISVLLGNSKRMYMNDKFVMNLGDGAYTTLTEPVWCYLVNAKGEILTKVQSCNAADLAALEISSEIDTGLSLFNIVLENYIIRGYTGTPVTDITAELKVDDGSAGYATAQELFTLATNILPDLPNPAVDTFPLTVTKDFNFRGVKPITKISFSAGLTVTYKHKLILVFTKDIVPAMADNVHACVIDDGGYKEIFCLMREKRTMIISGFPRDFSGTTVIRIEISNLDQGLITGNEMHYAGLYDENDELLKSGFSSIAPPAALTGKNLIVYDLAFSTLSIRDENSLTYKFNPTDTVPSGSKIHVLLEYFTYEYIILSLNLECTVEVGGSNIASDCRRIGKRVIIELSGSISSGSEAVVTINKLVTPNYKTCSMKNIVQYIADGAGTLQYISQGEYMNVEPQNSVIDPSVIYLNFEGLSSSDFIKVSRGTYNGLRVVREDGKRFNDELSFSLSRDYSGQFKTLNPLDIRIRDSYLGESNIPMDFGCESNALLTVFLLKVDKTERFKEGRFSPLPFLVIVTSEVKKRLPVPLKIEVYRGYESLPMILKLDDIPIGDLDIEVKIESFDSQNKLSLVSAASIKMNKDNLIEEIRVKSTHEITSDPISNTNSRIVLTPQGDSAYETTYIELQVVDLVVDTSIQFGLEMISISAYSCTIDLDIHMPLTIYYYIVPRILYQDLSQAFVEEQLKKGIFTDGYITYGLLNVERSLKDFQICGEDMMADLDYIIRIHYKTFVVQQALIDQQAQVATPPAASTTVEPETSTEGETQENPESSVDPNPTLADPSLTLLWDPLVRPDVNFSDDNLNQESSIRRLDQGSIWYHLKTETNSARQGYIDLIFEQGLTVEQRKNICCYFGQALSYPLENIWTDEGERCSSQQIADGNNYIQGELPAPEALPSDQTTPTNTNRRMLDQRKAQVVADLAIGTNTVRINIMPNLRFSQDAIAYATLTDTIYGDTFNDDMVAQYSLPPLNEISPLQESNSILPVFQSYANWTIMDDRTSVLIDKIKPKNIGYVHTLLLEKSAGLDDLVTYQHIRLGVNPVDTTVRPVASYSKYFESLSDSFSYLATNLTVDKTYVLFYYGSSNSPNLLPGFTAVYKLEFVIKGVFRVIRKAFGLFVWAWLGAFLVFSCN